MKNKFLKNLLYLLIGLFFFYFCNGKYNFALGAWLYPIFILLVSRRESKIYSYLIIPVLIGIVSEISFWYTFEKPTSFLFYIPFCVGLFTGFIYLVDRIIYPKINGFMATLIFPLTYTAFDFCTNLFNPLGTTGILGYSQFNFLSFSQLASITGMWGITFMITWFGSVVYWFIENYNDKKAASRGITIYLLTLLPILIYGNIRLILPLEKGTVQISGIHTEDRLEGNQILESLYSKDTITFKNKNAEILENLTRKTEQEASSGSKIIVWAENSFYILKDNEDNAINQLKKIASKNEIYLWVTPFVINKNSRSENKTLLFSPNGNLVSTHYKFGGNFLEGTVEGNQIIKTTKTTFGNLTGIVCWDGDFPSVVKQVGKENTDILFIPASDWEAINPLHSIIATFRGIENGCSVVRQTRNGLSFMNDPRGKTITQMDHFQANSWTMSGQVPNKKIWSLYPIIGDLFGWLSFVGLLFLVIKTLVRRKKQVLYH
ncbi:MAG: nitrilase-related carbon-nitrogen hydrolase [Flavobacterium sp.]